jgi:hypothetical protein
MAAAAGWCVGTGSIEKERWVERASENARLLSLFQREKKLRVGEIEGRRASRRDVSGATFFLASQSRFFWRRKRLRGISDDGLGLSLFAGSDRALSGVLPRPQPARRLARSSSESSSNSSGRRKLVVIVSVDRRGARLPRAECGPEQRRGGGLTAGGPRCEKRKKEREREGGRCTAERRKGRESSEFLVVFLPPVRSRKSKKKNSPRPRPTQKKKKKQSLHGRTLSGRRILQADEVVNAAASAKHR